MSFSDPRLRAIAERCVRAAPSPPPSWEYLYSRPADAAALDGELLLGGEQVGLSTLVTRIALADNGRQVDLGVYHAGFAGLPGGAAVEIAFVALDRLLGEDGVERWLGRLEVLTELPEEALPLYAVAELEEREAASPPWVELKGKRSDGAPAVIRARRPMRWIDHPLFEEHLRLVLAYAPDNKGGQPVAAEQARLDALCNDLEEQLGDGGVVVALVTAAGRCELHAYFDGQDDDASAAVRRLSARRHRKNVHVDHDPGWHAVRAFS